MPLVVWLMKNLTCVSCFDRLVCHFEIFLSHHNILILNFEIQLQFEQFKLEQFNGHGCRGTVFGIRCGKWHSFEGAWGGWGRSQRWPTWESYVANKSEFEYLFHSFGFLFLKDSFLSFQVLAGCKG